MLVLSFVGLVVSDIMPRRAPQEDKPELRWCHPVEAEVRACACVRACVRGILRARPVLAVPGWDT